MQCPGCSNDMVIAKATNFGEEYHYCRTCKKELKEFENKHSDDKNASMFEIERYAPSTRGIAAWMPLKYVPVPLPSIGANPSPSTTSAHSFNSNNYCDKCGMSLFAHTTSCYGSHHTTHPMCSNGHDFNPTGTHCVSCYLSIDFINTCTPHSWGMNSRTGVVTCNMCNRDYKSSYSDPCLAPGQGVAVSPPSSAVKAASPATPQQLGHTKQHVWTWGALSGTSHCIYCFQDVSVIGQSSYCDKAP